MSFRNALTLSVAAGILATLSVIPASAGTFAQFIQAGGGNEFQLTAPTTLVPPSGQVLSQIGASVPVIFTFQSTPDVAIGAPVGLGINAVLTLTATSTTGAAPTPGGGASEVFNPLTFTIKTVGAQTLSNGFVVGANTNLLSGMSVGTVPGTNVLQGTLGGNSATISGSDVMAGPVVNQVTFTSQYINFLGPPPSMFDAFAFSFSSVNPMYATTGTIPFIAPFTAAGTGTFSSTVVPEPGAVAMLAGLGVTGSVFAFRRLRRRR